MEEMKRNFSISSQIISLKSENDRVMENELEIRVDVTEVDDVELFGQLKMCIPPEIRQKTGLVGYNNMADGTIRKGEIFISPDGLTVSYSNSHYVDFDSILYSLHDEDGDVIIQLFYSIPMLNRYELLRNVPSISISLVGREGFMVIKKIPLSEHPGLTKFLERREAELAQMRVGLESDDDNGVYGVPRNSDEPGV